MKNEPPKYLLELEEIWERNKSWRPKMQVPKELKRSERLHASEFVRELLRLSIAFDDPRFEACFHALVEHGIIEAEGEIQAGASLKQMADDIIRAYAIRAELVSELVHRFHENFSSPFEPPKLGTEEFTEEFQKACDEACRAFMLRSGDLKTLHLEELPKVQFTSRKGPRLEVADSTNDFADQYQNALLLKAARSVMAWQKKSKWRACARVAALLGVPAETFEGAMKRVSRLFHSPKSGQGGAPPEF
jgi:hypothetical protein